MVRIEERLNGVKYRQTLEEIQFQSSRELRLGWSFTFQWDNDPEHLQHLNVLEWSNQSLHCSTLAQPVPFQFTEEGGVVSRQKSQWVDEPNS